MKKCENNFETFFTRRSTLFSVTIILLEDFIIQHCIWNKFWNIKRFEIF